MPTKYYGSVRVFYPRQSRAELIELLRARLEELRKNLPIKRAVLFGSWASGRGTAFSDVDLLVVYEGEGRDDAYGMLRQAIALRGLEPHVYTEAQARSLRSTLDRMARGGVVLLDASETPLAP